MTYSDNVSNAVRALLSDYSAEVTTPDRKSLDAAVKLMPAAAPVYIASLPRDTPQTQLMVAQMLRDLGLQPVPHIVARNIADRAALETLVRDLAEKAGVDRALILGGDRDIPEGEYDSSLQLIESGVLQEYGIQRIAIGCYPEGHPRISESVLEAALFDKLEAADNANLDIRLISQLCFDADIIARFIKSLRDKGVVAKIRVGLAGPATPSTLLKYAAICGVGPSMRALKEQQQMTRKLMANQTPETLLTGIAQHLMDNPELDITGVHFFTFASLKSTIRWAQKRLQKP